MNRRDVLKMGLGAMLAPLIRLDRSRERDMAGLVNEFCAVPEESGRYDVTSPWEFESDSIATDGFGLIRVPGLKYTATGEHGKRPDASRIFSRLWRPTAQWKPLPAARRVRPGPEGASRNDYCPVCARNRCRRCDGEGEFWVDEYRSLGKCSVCRGSGYLVRTDCPVCHGKRTDVAWCEDWGGTLISARYAELVRQIPGALWLPGRDGESAFMVRGDGGVVAMVMPACPAE